MKASELAKQLIENAKQNESIITGDVLRIASLTELKVIGRGMSSTNLHNVAKSLLGNPSR